jgi:hypothetical protein
MGCYSRPRVINIPFNKVNEECTNRNMARSPELLNRCYLKGLRIDWKRLNGYVGNSVHVEMELSITGNGSSEDLKPTPIEAPEPVKERKGIAKKKYEISIVTGTLNRINLLPGLIQNTVGASRKVELVLVDGGSTDGSQEYIKSLGNDQITLIEIGKRSHYAHYMNEGILRASADLICQWNDDVLLESSWENVLATIRPENDVYLFAWKSERVKDWTIYYNPPVEVVMNYGIYRRSVFERVGMFSGAYQYYRCDGDMSYRAWAFGCSVLCCRNIHVRELSVAKQAGACTPADDEAYEVHRSMYRCGTIPDDIERLAPR